MPTTMILKNDGMMDVQCNIFISTYVYTKHTNKGIYADHQISFAFVCVCALKQHEKKLLYQRITS